MTAKEPPVKPAIKQPDGGRYPTKGRQPAYESYVSVAAPRQTPEQFGGVSTD